MSELLLTFVLTSVQAKECNAFLEQADKILAKGKNYMDREAVLESYTLTNIYTNRYIACVIKNNTKIKDEK